MVPSPTWRPKRMRTALLDAAPELYGLVTLTGDPSRGSNLAETLPAPL